MDIVAQVKLDWRKDTSFVLYVPDIYSGGRHLNTFYTYFNSLELFDTFLKFKNWKTVLVSFSTIYTIDTYVYLGILK
jgi:hypothetical protein